MRIRLVKFIGTSSYTDLLSEQVILYTFRDQILDQNLVGFVYEAFLEYAMARYLRQFWNWIGAQATEIINNLKSLVAAAEEYRILQGVIQYLLLFIVDVSAITKFLSELA